MAAVLIPMMSTLLEMNAIESVTMTKCTCVYPSVAKAESSIFCSLIFNTFKKNEASAKEWGGRCFPRLGAFLLPPSLGTLLDTGQQLILRGLCCSKAMFPWSLSDEQTHAGNLLTAKDNVAYAYHMTLAPKFPLSLEIIVQVTRCLLSLFPVLATKAFDF